MATVEVENVNGKDERREGVEIIRYCAKTKKEFMKSITNFQNPVLKTGSDPYYELVNQWFLIKDDNDNSKSIDLPGCRLTNKQYYSKDIDTYIKNYFVRVENLETKYQRWIEESKLSKLNGVGLNVEKPEQENGD